MCAFQYALLQPPEVIIIVHVNFEILSFCMVSCGRNSRGFEVLVELIARGCSSSDCKCNERATAGVGCDSSNRMREEILEG